MFRSKFGWSIILIVTALLGVAWISNSRVDTEHDNAQEGIAEAPIPGYAAPDFTLSTTLGKSVSLSDFRGKPVVLNFWATWCPPCRAEIPHFQDSSVKYGDSAIILGIDQGEPQQIVADFTSSFGVTYPVLLDTDSAVNREYSVRALPTTIFVDADGVVREVYSGIVNRAVLEDRIEKLLAEG